MTGFSQIERREYKMMLHHVNFGGGAKSRNRAAVACWNDFSEMLGQHAITTAGALIPEKPKRQRNVCFLDTKNQTLRRDHGLVFRLRRRRKKSRLWDATLKFRSGDHIQSGHHQFRCRDSVPGKTKYEEDVKASMASKKPMYVPLFSRSATAKKVIEEFPTTLGKCLEHFDQLENFNISDPETPVQQLGYFEATEHVFLGTTIFLPNQAKAECAIVVWTDTPEETAEPLVAEFSFRFDLDKGKGELDVARSAWDAFTLIYSETNWVNPNGMTKTAFVYEMA